MINSEKYNIICLSNQVWDFPNWTNKRHVMSRLAKEGHNVLFVDPPINTGRLFLRQILTGQWGLRRLLTQQYIDSESGARVYSPLNPIPSDEITSKMHVSRINDLAEGLFDKDKKTILWIYHIQITGLEKYINGVNHDLLVYDCVDNYSAFPENSTFYSATVSKDKVIEQEKMLTKKADVVFGTTPGLVEKLLKWNENVNFTPNVGDYERFKDVKKLKDQIPEDIASIPRPRIGFTGALDEYKFDAKLVRKIAEDHPDYSFVLIGQIALKEKNAGLKDLKLDGLKNVYYLGSRPYEQKQYYMAGFDMEIIPYQLNDYTVGGCFPVKFHDDLAAGLPVVVTDLPAYAPFKDVSYIAKNYEEFSEFVKEGIEEDSEEKIRERQNVAKENNWDGKVRLMLGHVEEAFDA